jgi:hypothetical protein
VTGERKWGETYKAAVEATGYSVDTLTHAKRVCETFDFCCRQQNLSFSHHRIAASLPPAERDARLWEIAENLHRAELLPVERAERIDEWRRLTVEKGLQDVDPSGGVSSGHRYPLGFVECSALARVECSRFVQHAMTMLDIVGISPSLP